MTTAVAIAITTVAGGGASEDGQAILLATTISTGAEVVISVPSSEMANLLAVVAVARTEARRRQGLSADETEEMFVVKHFALGRDSGSRAPVLVLTLFNGARLALKLTDEMLTAMHATMQAMQGGSVPVGRPPGPLN